MLTPGTRLGPYEIVSSIGEGGMGEVYKARDTRLDREVAVKIVKGGFSERFTREAKTIAALNHPHVCTLYDVGPDYLVMELVEGIALKGPLPLKEVLRLGQQICEALDAAHRKGITHRDLKPANILVTKNGVKLLDFGLAKGKLSGGATQDATITEPLTQHGTIIGTIPYMAPEQLQGSEADARSDIFSLGCVLHEMVKGERPFQGKTQVSVMAAILEHDPPSVEPPGLERVIKLCLAKNPDDRWQSARDVALELREVTDQPATGTAPLQPRSTRRTWVWPAIAAVSIAVAAGALWTARSPARDTAVPLRLTIPMFEPVPIVPNLSPDGKRLIYTAGGTNRTASILRPMEASEARPIPGSETWESQAIWSPDGRSIAFALQGKLQKMPVGGGPMEMICALTEPVYSGAWGSEGTLLLVTPGGLKQVPATGGTPAPALKSAPPGNQLIPQFLPDGRQFLFFLRASEGDKAGMYLAALGGAAKLLLPGDRGFYARQGDAEALVYYGRGVWAQRFDSRSGQLSGEPIKLDEANPSTAANIGLISASQTGVVMWQSASAQQAELIWLDRTGKKLGQLPAPASASNPKISWQGSRVAYTAQGLREIDYTEVSRGVVRKVAAADAALYHPLWSPDGNKIVYYSKGQILMRDTDTDGAPVEVAKGPKSSAAFLHDWSRDGRYITYAEFGAKGGLNLMALPMNGLKPSGDAFLVFHSTQRSLHTALSPDSQWVAFSTNEDNHYQVFVTPLADQTKTEGRGPRWQVSTEGGVDPKWSTDGKQIYFLNNGFKKLLAADFKPGNPPTFSTPRPVFDWSFAWSAGVRNSYTIDPSSGRILVVSPISQTYSPITVLVNWAGLLKKN